MPPKLNPLCKRLFLEFPAKKYSHQDKDKYSSFEFSKYLILSKSFLHAFRRPQPVLRLKIIVLDLVRVSFIDASEADDLFYHDRRGLNMTVDSCRKVLMLFNPPVVCATLSPFDLPDEFQNVFDNYEGKLYFDLELCFSDDVAISLVNRWNPKISSILCRTGVLLSEEVLPLEVEFCRASVGSKGKFSRILDRHKITSFNARHISFADEEEGGEFSPPKNIGDLKHLKVHLDFDTLDSFAGLLVKTNASLMNLSLYMSRDYRESPANSMSDLVLETYHKVLAFKEQCSSLTKKLHVELFFGHYPEYRAEFKPEQIKKLRERCHLLKEADYKIEDGRMYDDGGEDDELARGRYHSLKKEIVEGFLTIDLTVLF